MKNFFQVFSQRASDLAGTPWAFLFAVTVVVVWALSGHAMGFSDLWLLLINTITTIITFEMVFIIQAAQIRDAKIARIERQIILEAIPGASNTRLKLEEKTDQEIDQVNEELRQARAAADAEDS